jgi:hypothetical protein
LQNQQQDKSKEDAIVLFADAVVGVFAVMVELFDAAFAGVAMIAIFMHIHSAFLTKLKQLPIFLLFFVGLHQ